MDRFSRNDADRSYGQPSQSSQSWSIVTKLILVTVGVFLLQLVTKKAAADSVVFNWLAAERDLILRSGQVWRLLTYAFCHSETHPAHVICNMVALFFLGRIVAQTLGQREFLCVYLVAAVFAGIVQICSMALFPSQGQDWTLGASGAVSAVFMLFALHYPRLKLYFFGILPIEARWLLAVAVTYDALGFLGLMPSVFGAAGATVGHAAHLGGLIFGFLYFRWEMNLTRWWDRQAGNVRTLDLPRTNLKVYNPSVQPEADYSDQVDSILAKISREGESSLTERERRILTQASAHLKSTP